jgi:hypothetical protein
VLQSSFFFWVLFVRKETPCLFFAQMDSLPG